MVIKSPFKYSEPLSCIHSILNLFFSLPQHTHPPPTFHLFQLTQNKAREFSDLSCGILHNRTYKVKKRKYLAQWQRWSSNLQSLMPKSEPCAGYVGRSVNFHQNTRVGFWPSGFPIILKNPIWDYFFFSKYYMHLTFFHMIKLKHMYWWSSSRFYGLRKSRFFLIPGTSHTATSEDI